MVFYSGIKTMHKKLIVHEFYLGDPEDPEVLVAQPLYIWQVSEFGKWVMNNASTQPEWTLETTFERLGYKCIVTAEFEDERITECILRMKK